MRSDPVSDHVETASGKPGHFAAEGQPLRPVLRNADQFFHALFEPPFAVFERAIQNVAFDAVSVAEREAAACHGDGSVQ